MLQTIATGIFFGVYAVNYVWPFGLAGVTMAICAAIITVCIVVSLAKQ